MGDKASDFELPSTIGEKIKLDELVKSHQLDDLSQKAPDARRENL
jgi:hypothetical protein